MAVRRELKLARPRLVSRQLSHRRVAAKIPLLLRRRLPRRVPHGFGADDDSVGSRCGAFAQTLAHLPSRRRRPPPRLRRLAQVSGRHALARPPSLLRILPRRQRRWIRCFAPDGLDWTRRETLTTERRMRVSQK